MSAAVWTANIVGWPIIHLVTARAFVALSPQYFHPDDWLTRQRAFERDGLVYRRLLHVQRWKRILPDGAPFVGGFSKKRVMRRDPAYLHEFLAETCRAEWAHWCMLACTPFFFLWNPPWACAVMAVYGLAANLPCIVAQRANRIQLRRMLPRTKNAEPQPALHHGIPSTPVRHISRVS